VSICAEPGGTGYVAIDFETSYEKDRDIKSLGMVPYLRHPATDIYMVSIYGEGIEYVGPPETAPWDQIESRPWVSHNMQFDRAVYDELRRRRPGFYVAPPDDWDCSADLVAAMQCKRSLADAMFLLEGVRVDKSVRDEMKGVAWKDLDDAGRAKWSAYAVMDSKYCSHLWDKYSDRQTEFERKLSRHTARMCHRGLAVNEAKISSGIDILSDRLFKVEKLIPWAGELNEKGKEIPITSSKAIANECRKLGIPPPASTDVKSALWDRWEEQYAEQAPFVGAIQKYRKINRVLGVLKSIRTRTVDGICYYEMKYCGAPHTRRWSGGYEYESNSASSSLNIQNLPKDEVEGVDVRSCFVARPGHRFVVSDLSQIEARVILWMAGEEAILAPLRKGADLYDSYARTAMGYRDPRPLAEVDKGLRQLAKTHWLGLGYGMSAGKLRDTARKYGYDISAADAEVAVNTFRRGVPRIKSAIWDPIKSTLARHQVDGKVEIVLPSGRAIRYFNVRRDGFGFAGQTVLGDPEKNLWFGLCTENAVQGTARDALGHCILELERAGYPVAFHVHDEPINEVPEEGIEKSVREINRIMSTAPDWAAGLPMSSGTEAMVEYCKK
jgi:DNA polymerase I-like protein with 3'-5' exonuclease and polymerase domains